MKKSNNIFHEEDTIVNNFLIMLLISFILCVMFFLFFNNKKEHKGYVISKFTNIEQIHGKHVQPNIYGITFHVVYQEDKTMIRYQERVSKEEYESIIPKTDSLITYYTINCK